MTASYQEMPSYSRVWIYQSTRPFDEYEAITIKQKIATFVNSWSSHGSAVKAYGDLFYNRFIVFMTDEQDVQVSGCSIDSSVKFVKDVQELFQTDFFNRFYVVYKDGEEVKGADRDTFRKLVETGAVQDETLVFNNLISTKNEFEREWEVPLKESWHKTVFSA